MCMESDQCMEWILHSLMHYTSPTIHSFSTSNNLGIYITSWLHKFGKCTKWGYKLHGFSLRHMALDDSIHGNLSEGNLLGQTQLSHQLPWSAPATVSEAHTLLQILMWRSETKRIVKQVFNLLWGNLTLQGLKPGWVFHTPQWPEQCLAFGMPHSTRVYIINPEGMNFVKRLQLDTKIVQKKKGTVQQG